MRRPGAAVVDRTAATASATAATAIRERQGVCAPNTVAIECDGRFMSCCETYCSISGDDTQCVGVGQLCVPLLDVPRNEDLGLCMLP